MQANYHQVVKINKSKQMNWIIINSDVVRALKWINAYCNKLLSLIVKIRGKSFLPKGFNPGINVIIIGVPLVL